ncbi:hypothetical protein G7054_g11416 [Neopestalotiopsis clavispora]|nr:hypothetical protein G7054_g11416 [Neopestalotiopsis clavispora]
MVKMAKYSLFETRRSLALLIVSLIVASLVSFSHPFKQSPSFLTTADGLNARAVPDVNITENHGLQKRIPYASAIEKGRALNCKMSADIAHATQLNGGVALESTLNEEEFVYDEDFGWTQINTAPKYGSTGLANTLQTLTGADPGQTQYYYILNNEVGPSGEFGGVIIADWNKSPRYADGYVPGFPVSALHQWSQAAMGEWVLHASGVEVDINQLKYIIRSGVTNGETQDQVFAALRAVGESQVPNFAGRKVFSRTATDENEANGFYAILGTPNGAGGAFLLATHKGKLGVKRFSSVTVWNHPVAAPLGLDRDNFKLMLSFEIEDVPNPTTGDA